jgi:excisionase family DNA binding protein
MELGMTTPVPDTAGRAGEPLAEKWRGHSTFSVEEFAEIFGLSRTAAYAAIAKGFVSSVRIGRRIMIPRLTIERLLGGA